MVTKKATPIKKVDEVEELKEVEETKEVENTPVAPTASITQTNYIKPSVVVKLFYGQSASVVERTIADWIEDTSAAILSASSCYDQRENVVITTVVASV